MLQCYFRRLSTIIFKCNRFDTFIISSSRTSLPCLFQRYSYSTEPKNPDLFNEDVNISKEQLSLYFKNANISDLIVEKYAWILQIPPDKLQNKMSLLNKSNFKSDEHKLPFLRLTQKRLLSLMLMIKKDEHIVPGFNRLYYMSDTLKVDPNIVADRIAQRLFVYTISFPIFKSSLETIIELGAKPQNILRDLWCLKIGDSQIRQRLEKVAEIDKDKVMPWMVRCKLDVLERSIQLNSRNKKILGDESSTLTYLAKRLNTTLGVIDKMSKSTSAIKTMSVSKLKETVDYLLEQGYTEADIIEVPRIFGHSLKTIKNRKKILKDLGIFSNNLKTYCRTARDFKHFCEFMSGHKGSKKYAIRKTTSKKLVKECKE